MSLDNNICLTCWFEFGRKSSVQLYQCPQLHLFCGWNNQSSILSTFRQSPEMATFLWTSCAWCCRDKDPCLLLGRLESYTSQVVSWWSDLKMLMIFFLARLELSAAPCISKVLRFVCPICFSAGSSSDPSTSGYWNWGWVVSQMDWCGKWGWRSHVQVCTWHLSRFFLECLNSAI